MRNSLGLVCTLLLVGCGASDKLNHKSRTVGATTSPVRVVHYSATW